MTASPHAEVDQVPGAAAPAVITIDRHHRIGRVDPMIYGHFLESNFYGNIEGGVFDEGSSLALGGSTAVNGLRSDVIELCRNLGVPIVRWPGGNFTSAYHWEDGIGPRDTRPRRLDLTWGGEESNRFGTDEFLAWCAEVGTEPLLVHSCRSVDDAVRWVEYTNYGGDTAYARARAANGHPEPYGVRYWGIGNEVYGPWQMGHRSAEAYAADAREHARFMRMVDPELKLIGVGTAREEWMRPVLAHTGQLMDYLSLHLYGAATHLATRPDDAGEYDAMVAQSLYFEQQIAAFSEMISTIAGELGIERPLSIALDEWNMRHLEPAEWPEPRRGDDGGVAPRETPVATRPELRVNRYSPRTLADALFYAGVFHGLHRLSGLEIAPTMANTVNLINANALIAVRPGGALGTATYHVWDLYQNHLGPVALPVRVDGPVRRAPIRQGAQQHDGEFLVQNGIVPHLDAIATTSADRGSLQLVVINRHSEDPIDCRLITDDGLLPSRADMITIGAGEADLYATNSFDDPQRVALRHRGSVEIPADGFRFEPHSITALRFDLT